MFSPIGYDDQLTVDLAKRFTSNSYKETGTYTVYMWAILTQRAVLVTDLFPFFMRTADASCSFAMHLQALA